MIRLISVLSFQLLSNYILIRNPIPFYNWQAENGTCTLQQIKILLFCIY